MWRFAKSLKFCLAFKRIGSQCFSLSYWFGHMKIESFACSCWPSCLKGFKINYKADKPHSHHSMQECISKWFKSVVLLWFFTAALYKNIACRIKKKNSAGGDLLSRITSFKSKWMKWFHCLHGHVPSIFQTDFREYEPALFLKPLSLTLSLSILS